MSLYGRKYMTEKFRDRKKNIKYFKNNLKEQKSYFLLPNTYNFFQKINKKYLNIQKTKIQAKNYYKLNVKVVNFLKIQNVYKPYKSYI